MEHQHGVEAGDAPSLTAVETPDEVAQPDDGGPMEKDQRAQQRQDVDGR